MNMTFIKNLDLCGCYVEVCKTVKEFMHELKNYANFTEEYFHGCTFKQYMNNEYDENDTYKSVEENVDKDVFIWIEYNDGSHFCYCEGKEGNFKLTKIKWAYISDGSGYTVYKYDLCEEWEQIRETLTEEEENAIENGISIENYRIHKALQAEEQETEQAVEPAEKTARSTKNSVEEEAEEITEEPEIEEQAVEPAEETEKSTENSAFRYKINILEVLKEIGYTSTRIRKEKIFAQVTLQKFRTGDTNISLQTVADICNLTGLQPWDILSFSEKTTEEPKAEK